MKSRTFNTLFLLISVDGKISTGSVDARDTDKDYRNIDGIKEGLQQYYDIEKTTDRHSFNTGRVMAKIGVNTDHSPIHCPDVNFIIADNNHLTEKGVANLANNLNKLYLATKNPDHPVFDVDLGNIEIIKYENKIDFVDLFQKLRNTYNVDRVTIQSGGTVNSILIRNNLIDELSIVVAPCLVGGKDTSSLVDGENIISDEDLKDIKALKLEKADILKDSYIHLSYKVINSSKIYTEDYS